MLILSADTPPTFFAGAWRRRLYISSHLRRLVRSGFHLLTMQPIRQNFASSRWAREASTRKGKSSNTTGTSYQAHKPGVRLVHALIISTDMSRYPQNTLVLK